MLCIHLMVFNTQTVFHHQLHVFSPTGNNVTFKQLMSCNFLHKLYTVIPVNHKWLLTLCLVLFDIMLHAIFISILYQSSMSQPYQINHYYLFINGTWNSSSVLTSSSATRRSVLYNGRVAALLNLDF